MKVTLKENSFIYTEITGSARMHILRRNKKYRKSNIDKNRLVAQKNLKTKRTASKYLHTFIHYNSHVLVLNDDYMFSIYTYSHSAH
jgi:hypothetical protein